MLQQPMINKMLAMRLHGMAEALKTQEQDANTRELVDAGIKGQHFRRFCSQKERAISQDAVRTL